jgi:hypothetical protein
MEVPYNLVQARFKNAVKRSKKYEHSAPIEAEFLSIVKECDGKCFYCGTVMIASGFPTKCVFSIDHKIPLCYSDGSNDMNNLCVACHRCNIVKGTLRSEVFVKLISLLSVDMAFYEVYMKEMFAGRKAEKIERIANEKMMFPLSGEDIVKFM